MAFGTGNPYRLPLQALENSRQALSDIMAASLADRQTESRLRVTLAGMAADKELAKMSHERKLADIDFRNEEARRTAAHRSSMLEESRARTAIAQQREDRLGAERREQRKPLTRDQAFDALGIGPQERLFINTIVPPEKKMPAKAWVALTNDMKERPRLHGAWVMSKLYDKANTISEQPPSPENLAALQQVVRQIDLVELGVSPGGLKAADTIKAREILLEQWEDVAAFPEGAMYQQFMLAAGNDEAAAADLFVKQGLDDLKRVAESDPFEKQAQGLKETVATWTDKTRPQPPEGLAEQVARHIDTLAMEKGPEAAGAFKQEAEALLAKNDWKGLQALLPAEDVPDEMAVAHRQGGEKQPVAGGPGEAIAAEGPPAQTPQNKPLTTRQLQEFMQSGAAQESRLFQNVSRWKKAKGKKDEKLKRSFLRQPPAGR